MESMDNISKLKKFLYYLFVLEKSYREDEEIDSKTSVNIQVQLYREIIDSNFSKRDLIQNLKERIYSLVYSINNENTFFNINFSPEEIIDSLGSTSRNLKFEVVFTSDSLKIESLKVNEELVLQDYSLHI
ncbi:MAG: hypothetical protein MUW56_13420 [Chryseobacterium sp.]|uniref:hypothetical protein n=1 Tax=Chryseobacterium sp. TaxID=1871047 RepID=UPI0025BDDD0F|nr:hypothetical protein [Chryseobacterium sp.]MCJ7934594.1 hypothetical protein [Chryseobacterium sp.]